MFCICVFVILFGNCYEILATANLPPPTATLKNLNYQGQLLTLNDVPNTEVVEKLNQYLLFECFAKYPVQWTYSGNAAPQFVAIVSTENTVSNGLPETIHQAFLTIEKTQEHHTGKYKCQSTEYPDILTYFYLYLPGQAIFTASRPGENLFVSSSDTHLKIPCTVSQKDAIVSLRKSTDGNLKDLTEPYNSRVGFTLKLSDEDPNGLYLCSARYGNVQRVMEYNVVQHKKWNN